MNLGKEFWAGACALILAVAVGTALAGAILIIALDDKADDAQLADVITTLAGAAVGAVATYLGARVSRPGTDTTEIGPPGPPGPPGPEGPPGLPGPPP